MAYFTEVDEAGKGIRVVDAESVEWCIENLGGQWILPFADVCPPCVSDAYCHRPDCTWTKNADTYLWEPPVPMPTDGKFYTWNEEAQTWDEVE